ncbi:hypothetical protein B0J12DRAFT_309806 [Macrophomina phaseolina]|uniref:Uncharacterized protein n=1 Tax=Macrophomina phaseolina TaxID=35725 RepID=A0ABQ8FX05_9PEZI|nr:hypothetical protein B0J12DRAFT_309806 [Macrophomina phaseolina]
MSIAIHASKPSTPKKKKGGGGGGGEERKRERKDRPLLPPPIALKTSLFEIQTKPRLHARQNIRAMRNAEAVAHSPMLPFSTRLFFPPALGLVAHYAASPRLTYIHVQLLAAVIRDGARSRRSAQGKNKKQRTGKKKKNGPGPKGQQKDISAAASESRVRVQTPPPLVHPIRSQTMRNDAHMEAKANNECEGRRKWKKGDPRNLFFFFSRSISRMHPIKAAPSSPSAQATIKFNILHRRSCK